MAIQTINIGNRVNDGLGDDLRTAFEKVNANFTELSNELATTGVNLGDTGAGIFAQRTGGTLEFKSLVGGTKITLQEFPTSVEINSTQPDAFTQFDTDSGSVNASVHTQLTLQGIQAPGSYSGVKDIEVTNTGSSVNFKTILPFTEILTSYDFGFVTGAYNNAVQFATANTNIDFGTLSYESGVSLDAGTIS